MRRTCSRCGKRRKVAMSLSLTNVDNVYYPGKLRAWKANFCLCCTTRVYLHETLDKWYVDATTAANRFCKIVEETQ